MSTTIIGLFFIGQELVALEFFRSWTDCAEALERQGDEPVACLTVTR